MLSMDLKTIGLCTITALAILLIMVERTQAGQTPAPVIITDTNSTRAIAEANNRLAFDLYTPGGKKIRNIPVTRRLLR
jgi:serine protease inhibitor